MTRTVRIELEVEGGMADELLAVAGHAAGEAAARVLVQLDGITGAKVAASVAPGGPGAGSTSDSFSADAAAE